MQMRAVLCYARSMTPAEFKRKWARYSGKETSAYQEHFNDLCALLGQPSPVTADPTGSESFCFQKRVVKDAELFAFDDAGRVAEETDQERGFADVWKRDCFAWEYKGRKKNLDEAYRQLLRYRESLLNPRLLVVCDFDRYIGPRRESSNFSGQSMARGRALCTSRTYAASARCVILGLSRATKNARRSSRSER